MMTEMQFEGWTLIVVLVGGCIVLPAYILIVDLVRGWRERS